MDISVLLGLQTLRNSLGEGFAKVITQFSDLVLNPVLYVILALFFWCVNKRKSLLYIMALIGANFFNNMLKIGFCVFRPWLRDARLIPFDFSKTGATGYSFPSGHSTSSAALAGAIAWTERKRKAVRILCIAVIILIGFTRVFLGVHTPQDVLIGWLVGVLSIILFNRILQWIDNKPERDLMVLTVSLVLLTAGLIYTNLKGYATVFEGVEVVDPVEITHDVFSGLGMGYGLILGWFIERRWIRFSVEGSTRDKVIRGLIGTVGMALVYLAPKHLLYSSLGSQWGRFVLYFVTLMYATAFYPWIITKLKKH